VEANIYSLGQICLSVLTFLRNKLVCLSMKIIKSSQIFVANADAYLSAALFVATLSNPYPHMLD
jgi:hypothetical protein